ncbi:MAG: RNA polymerase sigma factor [Lachnospiraceae bacterium]|nr:RNA polymerase sigma factor [Lachnospiraceae bacterium]
MLMLYLTSVNQISSASDPDRLDACLSKIAAGNRDSLAELYNHTKTSVYSFALSVLKNTQDAEDVLHDCYLAVYSAAASYHSSGKPLAWILTITRNLCLQRLRSQQRTAYLSEEEWLNLTEGANVVSTEDRLILRECLYTLTDEERQVIVLHAVSGFRHREIAQLLELPLSTVLSKYNRAVKKLRKRLREEDAMNETK